MSELVMYSFVKRIPYSEVDLEVFISSMKPDQDQDVTDFTQLRIFKDLGVNGKANFLAFLCYCFLEQVQVNRSLCEGGLVLTWLSALLSLFFIHGKDVEAQLVIDEELWQKKSTAVVQTKYRDMVYYYGLLLVQEVRDTYKDRIEDDSIGGNLSQSPLSILMRSLLDGMVHEEIISTSMILHYAYDFVQKGVYMRYLGEMQSFCNPLARIHLPHQKTVRDEATESLRLCNYIDILHPYTNKCDCC